MNNHEEKKVGVESKSSVSKRYSLRNKVLAGESVFKISNVQRYFSNHKAMFLLN